MQMTYKNYSPRYSPKKKVVNLFQQTHQQSPLKFQSSALARHMTSSQFMTALADFRKGESPTFSPNSSRTLKDSMHLSPSKNVTSIPYLHQGIYNQKAEGYDSYSRGSPGAKVDMRKESPGRALPYQTSRLNKHINLHRKESPPHNSKQKLQKKVTFGGQRRFTQDTGLLTFRSHNSSVSQSLMQLRQPSYPSLTKPSSPQTTFSSILRNSPSPPSPPSPRKSNHQLNCSNIKNSLISMKSSHHELTATVSSQSTNSSNGRVSDMISERCSSSYKVNSMQIGDFMVGREIGSGQFGKVFIAKHINTGFLCALKKISKALITQKNILSQLIRQIKIQSCLDHPNICKLYGVFPSPHHIYLIMQLATCGQLYKTVKQKRKLQQPTIAYIVKQVCEAVRYLHTFKIIHRDIKPENIVMQYGVVKLCDFGWAVRRLGRDEMRGTFCGTPFYVSPEILKGEMYNEKIDIWSVGILAYELLVGEIPFRINSEEELVNIIRDQIRFPEEVLVSYDAKDFVMKFLQKNPEDRYKISELLQHSFLKQCRDMTMTVQL